jgi:flagellar motor protein MotB
VRRLALAAVLAVSASGALGCAAGPMRVASLDEVERVRITESAREAAATAPEVYARAEQEREFARAAHRAGDDVAANLHAERALAAYGHAAAVARLAAAVASLADAQKALDDATTQEQSLSASRAKLELDAQDLERREQIARSRLLPASSADAAADREAARLAAARSLGVEARLLCSAAQLVVAATAVPGATATTAPASLGEAQGEVDKLDARLGQPAAPAAGHARSAVVDDAGAARAHCLDALTRARRAVGDGGHADALLAELSATGGWAPTRDERGVVVTLRDAFEGAKLTDDGQAKLENLGRVAAAHPGFGVQIVVHDAQPRAPKDESDARRADAAVKALVTGGATATRVRTEQAGTHAPAVDPTDPRLRARNERIDVVFVAGS